MFSCNICLALLVIMQSTHSAIVLDIHPRVSLASRYAIWKHNCSLLEILCSHVINMVCGWYFAYNPKSSPGDILINFYMLLHVQWLKIYIYMVIDFFSKIYQMPIISANFLLKIGKHGEYNQTQCLSLWNLQSVSGVTWDRVSWALIK